jgi:hypothetical protein
MAPKGKPEREYTDLDKLLARAKDFEAGGQTYKVLPLLVTDAIAFGEEYLWAYNALYLVQAGEGRERFVHWLGKAVRTDKGEPVTFDNVQNDGWTTADVTDCLKAIGGISG